MTRMIAAFFFGLMLAVAVAQNRLRGNKPMQKLGLALAAVALFASVAYPQSLGGISHTPTIVQFTTPGANSWTVPPGVTTITITRMCGGGGGGGGGQASANTAGGGGGGAARCLANYPYAVTPGSTLTITIGAAGLGGAAGSPGTDGGNTSISGGPLWPTALAINGGGHGLAGSAGVGGTGGAEGIGGNAGGAAGVAGTYPGIFGFPFLPGGSGGGGGNTAGTAGAGAYCYQLGTSLNGIAGTGNGAGGGAGGSCFGAGANGSAKPTAGLSADANQWGGGGGGGSSNAAGGNGQTGFVEFYY